MLNVTNLEVHYGPVAAVKGISFEVRKGELVSIIGANGAGKTSTLNAVMGLVVPTAGKIELNGQDLDKVPVESRTRLGVAVSPEGRRVFKSLSILDNLRAGGTSLNKEMVAERIDLMMEQFPTLRERRHQDAGTLSGGEQQMLAIARALMIDPSCLILDEPSLGLAPKIVSQVFALIEGLKESGVTVLLVEQNVKKSLAIADRAYVMELGAIVRQGTAGELLNDEEIRESYLGGVS